MDFHKSEHELLDIINSSLSDSEKLRLVFTKLHSWFNTASHGSEIIDRALVLIELSDKSSPLIIVGVLRATCRIKSKLKNWKSFYNKVSVWLDIMNEDTKKWLVGLDKL
jgi:hypothetical protein